MDNSFFNNFKLLMYTLDKSKNRVFKKFGITSSQADILLYLLLNKEKEIYQKNIENQFSLSNPTVNGIVDRLESKKLIFREKIEKDKRLTLIRLTPQSLKLEKNIVDSLIKFNENIMKEITENEIHIFEQVINKMLENIKNIKFEQEKKNERNI